MKADKEVILRDRFQMSQYIISTANLISHRVTIYFGIPIFILCVIGEFLNIIVFLSLKTFRQNSCAFYLTIMAMISIGYLFTDLLKFIMMMDMIFIGHNNQDFIV